MNSATGLARKITREIVQHGITDVVISPGSRNAPLSIALYQAEQRGLLKLHIRIDERTAAFFALGIAKASKRAVAILCTSGTAAANYHPAILEARHSMVPLLIITADRPARLRETGANQTTLQASLYVDAVTYAIDLAEESTDLKPAFAALPRGPVHLNVQFDEPLLTQDESDWLAEVAPTPSAPLAAVATSKEFSLPVFDVRETRGVLVIGHDHGGIDPNDIAAFATQLGWPVIAEDPLSFPSAVAHSSLFLASEKIRQTLAAQVAVVIGRSTLSRSTNTFVKSATREVVIDPKIATVDYRRSADEIFTSLPALNQIAKVDAQWLTQWEKVSKETSSVLAGLPQWCEPSIANSVAAAIPEGTSVFIASSRPVRDMEAFAQPRSGLEVFANRGLAGIDGNVSTALGIASQRSRSLAILGDLSFLHDLTGLIGASQINLRILVINNDGGGIFSTLPQSGVAGFEVIFGTPHGKDPAALAQALGIPSVKVHTIADLLEKLSMPIRGLSVVVAEVPTRKENAQIIKSIYSLIEKL